MTWISRFGFSLLDKREQKKETSSEILPLHLIWVFGFTKPSWTSSRLWTCLWWCQLHIEMLRFSAETRRPFAQRAGWGPRSCRDTLSISVPGKHPAEPLTAVCVSHEYMRCYFIIESRGGDETCLSLQNLTLQTRGRGGTLPRQRIK